MTEAASINNFLPDDTAGAEPLKGLKNMKQWHEMVIDFMLLNPGATYKEIAEQFGVSPVTVSYVSNSDMFKMRLEERRAKFQSQVDGTAIERLQGKIAGVAERALDLMDEKIQLERQTMGIEATRETAEMALKALGYGVPRAQSAQSTTVVNVVVSRDDLARARERMAPPVEVAALPRPKSE